MAAFVCTECGFRVNGGCDKSAHVCNDNSVVRHLAPQFEPLFRAWLKETNEGKFATFYAERGLHREVEA